MQTQPLTPEQRNWLWANTILPTAFTLPLVAAFGAVLYFLYRRMGDAVGMKIFAIAAGTLLVLVTIAVAMHVRNNVLDAKDGVTRVANARLLRKHSSSRSPRTFYAEFESIGRVIVMHDVFEHLAADRTYRVVYSPRSKRCWSAS